MKGPIGAKVRAVLGLASGAAAGWIAHNAFRKGAALSFYTLFSLAPVVTIVMALVGILVDERVAREAFGVQLGALIGEEASRTALAIAESAEERRGGWSNAIAALVTLVGATTVFAELKYSLDEIWRVTAAPRKPLWEIVRARLLSFGLVLTLGFLLLVSLLVSTVLAGVGDQVARRLAGAAWLAWLAEAANTLLALAAVTLLFAAIYKWLPNARLAWRDVWLGAFATPP